MSKLIDINGLGRFRDDLKDEIPQYEVMSKAEFESKKETIPNDTLVFIDDDKKLDPGTPVDDALDKTSENAIANKPVAEAIEGINTNLNQFQFRETDGKAQYKLESEGADAWRFFSSGEDLFMVGIFDFTTNATTPSANIRIKDMFPSIYQDLTVDDFSQLEGTYRMNFNVKYGRWNVKPTYDPTTGILSATSSITANYNGTLKYPIYFTKNKKLTVLTELSGEVGTFTYDCSNIQGYENFEAYNFIIPFFSYNAVYGNYRVERNLQSITYDKNSGIVTVKIGGSDASYTNYGGFQLALLV